MTPARGREMIDFVREALRELIRGMPSCSSTARDVSLPIPPTRAGALEKAYP